jgi:hypothetical protein
MNNGSGRWLSGKIARLLTLAAMLGVYLANPCLAVVRGQAEPRGLAIGKQGGVPGTTPDRFGDGDAAKPDKSDRPADLESTRRFQSESSREQRKFQTQRTQGCNAQPTWDIRSTRAKGAKRATPACLESGYGPGATGNRFL